MIQFDGILVIMIAPILMTVVNSRKVEISLQSLGPDDTLSWNRIGNPSLIDPCVSAPCLNAGTCIASSQHPHSYICQCVPGYTGATCAKGLDECTGNPCVHGACVDDIGKFRCHCYPGFTGQLCEQDIDECKNSPCQNGGICHQTHPGLYSCQCPIGYRGFRCETDIDECMAFSPCQNGGMCREGSHGTYHCTCLPGFTGKDCEAKVPECSSSPCQNGGRCVEGEEFNSFQCYCPQGFKGRLCEYRQVINVCTRNASLCGENGRCLPTEDGSSGYRCMCVDGVMTNNRSCDIDNIGGSTFDPCKSFPCQNGGRCRGGSQGSYRCECRCGFTGAFCQTTLSTFDHIYNSSSEQCQNGGVCFRQLSGHPRCVCASNYTGQNCETPLNQCTNGSNLCLNNGTCIYNQTAEGFYCRCVEGFTGDSCQSRDTNTTTITNRGFPYHRSAIDPTLLIVILGILGTVGILIGVPMLCIYFRRRKRPRDFCFSLPAPFRRRVRADESTIYSTWIANSDANVESRGTRRPYSISANTTPPLTLYQSSSHRVRTGSALGFLRD